jgi:hypothetical protein
MCDDSPVRVQPIVVTGSLLHVIPDIWHQPLHVDEPFMDNATMEGQWVDEALQRLRALLADEGVDEHDVKAVVVIRVPGDRLCDTPTIKART